ncbi:MAG: putative acetyltransferase [Candidatus Azotimanducaceae bacterium]|jgi:putative acetyltransferase
MSLGINIRLEELGDIQGIHERNVAAFNKAPHTDHTEHFIVKTLRVAGALTILLVAEDVTQVVVYVALPPVSIASGLKG